MSRILKKSIFDVRIAPSVLPPAFLLPSRARYFNSTAQIVEPSPPSGPDSSQIPPSSSRLTAATPSIVAAPPRRSAPASAPAAPLDASVRELLPLLAAQPAHYIAAHIHARPYLVATGDLIRLPFRMPGVVPGDVLRLNRASVLGSRDYTLKGNPYLDERLFECRARVVGTESEPLRVKEKTKRRNRKVKRVKSKHKYTILRVADLTVKRLDELAS